MAKKDNVAVEAKGFNARKVGKAIFKKNKAVFKEALKDVAENEQYKTIKVIVHKALPAIRTAYNNGEYIKPTDTRAIIWEVVNRANGVKDVAVLDI